MPYTISDTTKDRALSMEEVLTLLGELASSKEIAKNARAVIVRQRKQRELSGLPFDTGFAMGLCFALGAFSGVCEEGENK